MQKSKMLSILIRYGKTDNKNVQLVFQHYCKTS